MPRALLAALLALAAIPSAAAAVPAAATTDDGPWATVNVCDTAKHPDAIGIRASAPGTPRGVRFAMRFRVQFRTSDGGWADVPGANSGWRDLGPGTGDPVQSGWSFTFADPRAPVTLRGMVRFRWRRSHAPARFGQQATTAGHRSSAGADPPGYSAATCTLGD
jgi:hypothetical protein